MAENGIIGGLLGIGSTPQTTMTNTVGRTEVRRPNGLIGAALGLDSTTTKAPPKASAAPKSSTTTVGTGLIAALNAYQQELLNNKDSNGRPAPLIEIADIYEIKFADSIIADASVVPSGGLDKALAVGATGGTAADKLLPNKQSMDPNSRARAAAAGQQIVQFIDQVIRSSSYIQDQSEEIWNQSTGTWEKSTATAQQFAWFQVLCKTEILGYDYKRNDNAYRMTFTIVPHEMPMLSSFFPSGKYRGVHKSYRYWFTGENNSVLSFEQSFNNQWTQAITGTAPPDNRVQKINPQALWKTNIFPASGQSNQGGDQNTNEPGANAADFLYTADLAKAKITIVGDPAWLPSPLTEYVNPAMFTTAPFFPDGTINSVASGAYFQISFNTPSDYNSQTGLIDPSTTPGNYGNTNTVSTIYSASKATHTFKGGKFTQELEGQWVTYDANPAVSPAATARETRATTPETITSRPAPKIVTQEDQRRLQTQPGVASPATTPLSIGTQQILNPVTQSDAPTLAQLQASVAYTTARRQGATPQQALDIAKSAFASGTAGVPTPPNKIVKDGNPG